MAHQEWLLFALTVLGVSLIPGPSTLLAFAHGARFGASGVLSTAAGNASATLAQATAASVGLGAIIAGSATLFVVIKYAGAAYLIYVGIQMWRRAGEPVALLADSARQPQNGMALFRSGFTVAASKPKAIAFFTALFPQFLSKSDNSVSEFAIMTIVCMLSAFFVAAVYGLIGDQVRRLHLSRPLLVIIQRLVGGLFVSSGIGVALTRNDP